MRPPEIIKTARLCLRLPTMDDANDIFYKYAQDPEVTKYLVWRPHESIAVTRDFLNHCVQKWNNETAFPWVITRTMDNLLLGMIELRLDGYRADLGYAIARPFWGEGYATEVVTAVIHWAMGQPEIYRVWATCDVENTASARVLEKAGMQREGILRRSILHPNVSPEPRDSYCYSITK